MAQNNKLKRRAQAFAAKHDVSYTVALKAVDEPLHELRDLMELPQTQDFNFATMFRVVDKQGSYGSVYSARGLEMPYMAGDELSQFKGLWEFIGESARRHQILKDRGLETYWEYRELQRSGILGPDEPELEPFFHHYFEELRSPYAPMYAMGRRLGLIPVNLSGFLEIQDSHSFIPVTPEQLTALSSGTPVGPIEGFRRAESDDPSSPDCWTDRYSVLAISKAKNNRFDLPQMAILFRRDLDELHGEMRARGLDPFGFTFRDLSDGTIEFRHFSSHITATLDEESLFEFGSTEHMFLWD